MRVNKASIFIFDEEDGCYKLYDSIGLGDTDDIKRYPKDNPLFKWVGERDEIVIREELERYSSASTTLAVIETLKMMGSELCLPLVTKQKLIGIINLGMKGKGEMYTHEDLELLETMANQATVAIENARLYEDLIRAKVQMQRADRLAALGTLTAGLAHEIRNPLVAIKTFTQLLPTRFDDTEFRDHFLKVTAGEVDRIASLVTELLDFARPSQPKLNSEDLNQVVEKMALLVDTESHKKNIKILKDLYASLPFVTLDKEQIKQVLLNILLNAVDATPENGTISVSTRPLTKNGYLDHVQVTIADTGKGIPEEDLEKVFTPFYTTKHTGSGLGLSISHQIVQEHQGNIEVESKLNVGTTFRINLPVNPSLTEKGRQRRSSDEKNVSH
jgi:signal transduction histidine kinase